MIQSADRPIHLSLIASLFIGLFFIVLSFTITAIASPYIVGDLGGDRSITTYALSFFGFGTAITIPLAKPLAARFGIKQVFPLCLLIFSITNFLSALAPTYLFFILTRLFMGMATGPAYPLLAHHFSCLVPSHKKIVIVWIFVTILVVTPVIGASWGGIIAYFYYWQAPFVLNGIAGLIMCLIIKHNLAKAEFTPLKETFDWLGWCFYAVGILCLTFTFTTAQQLDWYRSPILVGAFLIGLPAFGYFLLRCFTEEHPVFDLRLFAKPLFSLAMLSLSLLFAIYFGMIVLLAIWLTLDVQFTPLWIGVLIGTMGVAGFFPRYILEERLGRIDPRILISIAVLILAASCFYTTIFDIEINFGRIAISRILTGFGLALFLPPIFQILSQCYGPEKWIDTFEIFQSIRNLSSSLGTAIFSIVWQRRTVFYHERLGETLGSQPETTKQFLKKVKALHVPGDPFAQLNDLLDKSASSLALDDVFYLLGWILTALFIVLISTFWIKKEAFDITKVRYTGSD